MVADVASDAVRAPDVVGAWPGKRHWVVSLARRYARRTLRQRFDGVYAHGVDEARALNAKGPVIFACTHVCWWDAFALVMADAALDSDGGVLMDDVNLRRLPFMGAIGAIPLATDGGARVRRQLQAAVSALLAPRRGAPASLWIFPQGRQRASHLRPLGFQSGLRLLAGRAGVPVVPVALSYPWREAAAPSVALRFMAPITPSTSLVADVEASVIDGLNATDAAVDVRDEAALGVRLVDSVVARGAEDGLGARLLRRMLATPEAP